VNGNQKFMAIIFACVVAFYAVVSCGETTVKAQSEKTKQLQIMQSMQLYHYDRDDTVLNHSGYSL
jgi:predicted lipoprotein with Yx(FWY)xxD motif